MIEPVGLCARSGVHLTYTYFEPVLRFIPPITITRQEIDRAILILLAGIGMERRGSRAGRPCGFSVCNVPAMEEQSREQGCESVPPDAADECRNALVGGGESLRAMRFKD